MRLFEKNPLSAFWPALLAIFFFPVVALAAPAGTNKEFPLRWEYPDVHTLSTAQLYKRFPNVVIIDARTRLEWEILHIKGAILDSVDGKLFGHHFRMVLRGIRQKTNKPIVFYCNGHLCPKSYIATQRAQEAGIKNVYAYDSGIHDWTKAHPDLAVMFGKSPVTSAMWIPRAQFRKHELSPAVFAGIVRKRHCDCLVLDIRDLAQRDTLLFPGKAHEARMDDTAKIDRLIKQAYRKHETLFVFDAVGEQSRWFQYYLRKKGVHNYEFMRGGERGYVNADVS